MTSQVILANGHGMAIASDSAVTMGHRRTYDTSEKIYPLPQPHGVAVLHAGNAMFHRMPYSTIINSWIQSLGDHQLRFLNEYVDSFRKFLVEEVSGWCDIEQQSADFIENMNYEFQRIHNSMFINGKVVSPEEAESIWDLELKWVSQREAYGFGIPFANTIKELINSRDEKFGKIWSKQANGSDGVSERIEYWFADVPRTSEIDAKIKEYVMFSTSHLYPFHNQKAALLTFAGYGARSMIPAVNSLELHGALNGSILWDWVQDELRYADRSYSGFYLIELIGQDRAIQTFLRGYDSELVETVKSASSGAFDRKVEATNVGEQVSNNSPSEADLAAKNKIEEMIEGAFDSFGERTNLSSFRATVSLMPLASLSATAKSLIQIQELSLDSRGELPTVGGEVRVGTITKANGFKWV